MPIGSVSSSTDSVDAPILINVWACPSPSSLPFPPSLPFPSSQILNLSQLSFVFLIFSWKCNCYTIFEIYVIMALQIWFCLVERVYKLSLKYIFSAFSSKYQILRLSQLSIFSIISAWKFNFETIFCNSMKRAFQIRLLKIISFEKGIKLSLNF